MAFKLTYSDGQESTHDDDTVWELDDGVLKLGREEGKWSVLLSPSHWAVLELGGASSDKDSDDAKDDKDSDSGDDKDSDKDSDDAKDDKAEKADDKDSEKDSDKD